MRPVVYVPKTVGFSHPALSAFHPLVADWFAETLGQPTEAQSLTWPALRARKHTLLAAPTGSGKTLAAFLSCLDELICRGMREPLPDHTEIVYVSPLKALSNDIRKNLELPLAEIAKRAQDGGQAFATIRVAVRTGDTPAKERERMAKHPPHILVTTPESLYILLTTRRGRAGLGRVKTIIVDEIHAIADDKRGAHLALTLERLTRLCEMTSGERPIRVGLSATQKPIERIGALLTGGELPVIIDSGHRRHLDIAIEITDDELGAVASTEQLGRMYDRIAQMVAEHTSTLVFVNTRAMVERVAYQLEERLGEDQVVAHHGSLSRQLRLQAEQRLKNGQVKCAVATASLELGIDIGTVDLVVQVGSPRAIATFLQRVGRSGHSIGKTPRGRLFALTRDQLCECAALVHALRRDVLDTIELAAAPRDVLAQQIVATIASEEEMGEDELYALVTRAANYRNLPRAEFDAVLEMLSEGPAPARGRTGAYLHRDRINKQLKPRRGARLAAVTCGGAIPDNPIYQVVMMPDETPIGNLDEHFAVDSSPGDIVLLGNTSWRIRRIEAQRVLVDDAGGAPPTIPFWFGEAPARTRELSDEVSMVRTEIEAALEKGTALEAIAADWAERVSMSRAAAMQLVHYLAAARMALGGVLPTRRRIVAERFFDQAGGMQLILHAPLGARINKAWGLALRKKFCRSFNLELQAAATDDGIVISLGPVHSFPLGDVFQFLRPETAQKTLEQAVLGAPVFGVRWRWAVTRALAVLRRHGGKKVPPHLLRMRTDDLLSLVFPLQQACQENVVGDIEIPSHPLVAETMHDCLHEFMDLDGLVELLRGMVDGDIEVVARDHVEPSPLCHELINANPYAFLDDAGIEDRRTRAVYLPRTLRQDLDAGAVAIDAASIRLAEEQAEVPVRDVDELHDALLSLWLYPVRENISSFFAELAQAGRATELQYERAGQSYRYWVSAERLPAVLLATGGGSCDPVLPPLAPELAQGLPTDGAAAARMIVTAHLEHSGPRSSAELATFFGLDPSDVECALGELESMGAVLRQSDDGVIRFCDRRMLARIHRLTVGRLRREIEPVSAAALMRFLMRWQRVAKGAKLAGVDGLHDVLGQLQGFETAAGAWEREVLASRICDYQPNWLDQLCMSGQVGWARLSPRKGRSSYPSYSSYSKSPSHTTDTTNTRSVPTKAAPLALFLREDQEWLRASAPSPSDAELGELAKRLLEHLRQRGASFLADLVRDLEAPPTDIENALWELCGAGLATADGFSCVRVLVDRDRGQSRSHFDMARPRPTISGAWTRALKKARNKDHSRASHAIHSLPTAAGRWALLTPPNLAALDVERVTRQLLRRYGVLFRDLLDRESALPPWRDILSWLRRLEARGEVRGGRFVNGFVGEQFALPEVLQELRELRNPHPQRPEIVRIAATDPLNLVGVTSGGPRVPAICGNAILYKDGVPIASLEGGKRVLRAELLPGERVDTELCYYPPPVTPAEQSALPL
jgi:ATP-dependent Lhr-like helicase